MSIQSDERLTLEASIAQALMVAIQPLLAHSIRPPQKNNKDKTRITTGHVNIHYPMTRQVQEN